MGTISFSDFAKTLRSHLSNGENGPAFTQTLFENITDFDDVDSNPVYQKSDHTFKSISREIPTSLPLQVQFATISTKASLPTG